MKKTVRALGVLLSLFAVLAFASPALACGGGEMKDKTAEKSETEDSQKASMEKKSKQADKQEATKDDKEPS